jgi:hypothetical protein
VLAGELAAHLAQMGQLVLVQARQSRVHRGSIVAAS